MSKIDPPLTELIKAFNSLPYCYTLQCCSGHFFNEILRLNYVSRLLFYPEKSDTIQYSIAYIAVCICNCLLGRRLIEGLKKIALMDPEYIQFGCAQWFWQKTVNSYVLQVEPQKYLDKDIISIEYSEAIRVMKARDFFLVKLKDMLTTTKSYLIT
ncbi:MAG: hypothetical protein GY705_09220 [Bacteroidetes bacterium]|nr:hypothetical protein [Bacteroidota bacterium]